MLHNNTDHHQLTIFGTADQKTQAGVDIAPRYLNFRFFYAFCIDHITKSISVAVCVMFEDVNHRYISVTEAFKRRH